MDKKKAYQTIKKTIEELGSALEYMWGEESLLPEDIEDKEIAALFEGQTMVDHHGGEGQGDDYYTVWHFPAADIYINFQGWYASGNGSEYEEMQHVMPTQVMRTEYVKFKD